MPQLVLAEKGVIEKVFDVPAAKVKVVDAYVTELIVNLLGTAV